MKYPTFQRPNYPSRGFRPLKYEQSAQEGAMNPNDADWAVEWNGEDAIDSTGGPETNRTNVSKLIPPKWSKVLTVNGGLLSYAIERKQNPPPFTPTALVVNAIDADDDKRTTGKKLSGPKGSVWRNPRLQQQRPTMPQKDPEFLQKGSMLLQKGSRLLLQEAGQEHVECGLDIYTCPGCHLHFIFHEMQLPSCSNNASCR